MPSVQPVNCSHQWAQHIEWHCEKCGAPMPRRIDAMTNPTSTPDEPVPLDMEGLMEIAIRGWLGTKAMLNPDADLTKELVSNFTNHHPDHAKLFAAVYAVKAALRAERDEAQPVAGLEALMNAIDIVNAWATQSPATAGNSLTLNYGGTESVLNTMAGRVIADLNARLPADKPEAGDLAKAAWNAALQVPTEPFELATMILTRGRLAAIIRTVQSAHPPATSPGADPIECENCGWTGDASELTKSTNVSLHCPKCEMPEWAAMRSAEATSPGAAGDAFQSEAFVAAAREVRASPEHQRMRAAVAEIISEAAPAAEGDRVRALEAALREARRVVEAHAHEWPVQGEGILSRIDAALQSAQP